MKAQSILRPMTWLDIEEVVLLEAQLFPEDSWTAELFWSELSQVPDSREVMVAVQDNHIVGYVSLRFVGNEGDVNTIAVSPEHQGQGIGRTMLEWLESTAEKRGITQIFLDVRSDNESAIAMYNNHGYERIDQRRDYYATDVHAFVMRKRLAP